jgi:sugar phosphate isomerase/epimerase
MEFGICTTVNDSAAVKATGWDFVEERVDLLIQGLIPDERWQGGQRAAKSVLPVLAANVLVPPVLKITGPEVNLDKLTAYMKTVVSRCAMIGIKTLVFGSGGARNVPDGFDRDRARGQIVQFLKMVAPLMKQAGITLAVEHLNRKECNIINSVAEAMTYVRELNHPNVKCLVDSYHFWLNEESLETVAPAMSSIVHVHVSDKDRTPPEKNDYRPLFGVLKRGGYSGPISVEAIDFDIARDGTKVLEFVTQQWNQS